MKVGSIKFFYSDSNRFVFYRYRRKRPKVDASIFDSAMSHTRRADASEKEKKIACPLLDVFACGQVSSSRLYRLILKNVLITHDGREASYLNFNLKNLISMNFMIIFLTIGQVLTVWHLHNLR